MSKKKDNIINFPSSPPKLERQIEAILFAASEPLDIETIEKRLQTNSSIKKILKILKVQLCYSYCEIFNYIICVYLYTCI